MLQGNAAACLFGEMEEGNRRRYICFGSVDWLDVMRLKEEKR